MVVLNCGFIVLIFCYLLYSTANSAAAAGGILFFVSYFPYFFLQPRYSTLTWGQKIASSIVSNVAMAYGGQVIGMFEGVGKFHEPFGMIPVWTELLVFY